jgi:hypothetical protein
MCSIYTVPGVPCKKYPKVCNIYMRMKVGNIYLKVGEYLPGGGGISTSRWANIYLEVDEYLPEGGGISTCRWKNIYLEVEECLPGGVQYLPEREQYLPGGMQYLPERKQYLTGGDQYLPRGVQYISSWSCKYLHEGGLYMKMYAMCAVSTHCKKC